MKFRYIAIIAFIFLGIFAGIGLFSAQNCSQIGACRNCWSSSAIELTSASELCRNPPCTAESYLQQHNAIVDTFLCACEAKDDALDKQIEEKYFAWREELLSAEEICSISLSKRSYD